MQAWTFSQLEKFETCPRQFYHVRVKRDIVEPPTEHTIWGERVHTAMENRVLHGTPLPEGMEQWEGVAGKLCMLPGEKHAEIKMSIDKNFKPVEWRSKESWSRGIADLLVIHGKKAATFDYKTGKRKTSEQLHLYAGYTFATYPEVEEVETAFIWLKEKKIDRAVIQREDAHKIWQSFVPRVRKLESAYERDAWPARPSGLCRGWCPVQTCEFWSPKKKY